MSSKDDLIKVVEENIDECPEAVVDAFKKYKGCVVKRIDKCVCTVDGLTEEFCTMDEGYNGVIGDCNVALELSDKGKGKADCEYWKIPESA